MRYVPIELEEEFRNETEILGLKRLLLACYSGMFFVPFFLILDIMVVPEKLSFFLKLRFASVLVLFLIAFLIKFKAHFIKKNLFTFYFIGSLAVSTPVNIMVVYFGGHESYYYVGLILVIICLEMIFPWNLAQGAIVFGTIYFGYVGSVLIFDEISNWRIFFNNNFFLFSCIAYSFISIIMHNRYREKTFLSKIELRNAKDTLQEAFDKLKKVDEMKTNFVSSVSHELRTPLTSVIGFASNTKKIFTKDFIPILSEDDKKLKRKSMIVSDNLSIIVSEGTRLTKLINDVLDISKIEAGKLELDIQNVDILEVCKHVLSVVAGYPKPEKIQVEFVHSGVDRFVKGDRDRIVQVITNLMSNSLKFTEEGKVELKVEFLDDYALISINDTGIGICEEDLTEVFSRFKQIGHMLTDKPRGTGLGLPICREIVTLMEGTIWVESRIGIGSSFFFTLKYAGEWIEENIDNNALILPETERVVKRVNVVRKISKEVMDKNVLVVDDDPNIRKLICQDVEEVGYSVIEARDGAEALVIANDKVNNIGLILLDIIMPGVDGFDVLSAIKANSELVHIPVIVISAYEHEKKLSQLGADGLLTKPINQWQLQSSISAVMGRGSEGDIDS